MSGRLNLDEGTLNLDGGTLTLDGGTRPPRPPYNLSTAFKEESRTPKKRQPESTRLSDFLIIA